MNEPFVHKIYAGKVKQLGNPNASDPMDRQWETGMFKTATDEQLWLGKNGLVGDEVADKKNHGGPEKAIFAYPIKHYASWKEELAIDSIDMGSMGENFAVLELNENTVCIAVSIRSGDRKIKVSRLR